MLEVIPHIGIATLIFSVGWLFCLGIKEAIEKRQYQGDAKPENKISQGLKTNL
jgi:hypothetical protein